MKKKKLKAEIEYLTALLLESREHALRLEDEFLLRLQTEQSILDQIARVEADDAKYSQIETKGRVLALIQFIKQAIKQESLSELLAKEQAKRVLIIPERLLNVQDMEKQAEELGLIPGKTERTATLTCSGTGKPTQLIISGADQNGLPVVEKFTHREHEFQVGDLICRHLDIEGEDEGIYEIEQIDDRGNLLGRIQGETFANSMVLGWIRKENAYPFVEFPIITGIEVLEHPKDLM